LVSGRAARLGFAFATLAVLNGCGSCVGDQPSDKASAQPVNSGPSKLPPVPVDKAIREENRPRAYLDGGH